jgi:hypothetical protein
MVASFHMECKGGGKFAPEVQRSPIDPWEENAATRDSGVKGALRYHILVSAPNKSIEKPA